VQMGDLGEVFGIRAHPSRRRYARISNQMHSSSGSTEKSEAPWASSDQPNARGFSPNSLNKQASAAALCIKHVSANPQKTIHNYSES